MVFDRFAGQLPTLHPSSSADDTTGSLPPLRLSAFCDDIELAKDDRIQIRVAIVTDGDGYRLDFSDSAPLDERSGPFGVSPVQVRVAATLAVGAALDVAPTSALADRIQLECDAGSWIGGGTGSDPGRAATAMSRIYDAVWGALAQGWPSRVGAGSCSLGAIVELSADDERICEVIAGGEGAMPDRRGRSGWAGPILTSNASARWPSWLDATQSSRIGSGGGGARRGGDGTIREYHLRADSIAVIGLDRRGNPPHGIDRAGPPTPARVTVTPAGGQPRPLETWVEHALVAGSVLRVETAGGAGHGFGGYGDIEFDASDWFGSKPSPADG